MSEFISDKIKRKATGICDRNGDLIFTGDLVVIVRDCDGEHNSYSYAGKVGWVHGARAGNSLGGGPELKLQDTDSNLTESDDWTWVTWLPASWVILASKVGQPK